MISVKLGCIRGVLGAGYIIAFMLQIEGAQYQLTFDQNVGVSK